MARLTEYSSSQLLPITTRETEILLVEVVSFVLGHSIYFKDKMCEVVNNSF